MTYLNRNDLATAIESACLLRGADEVVVVGLAALLGSYDVQDLPENVDFGDTIDIYVASRNGQVDPVDRSLGLGSNFERHMKFHLRTVCESQLDLPSGWRERLVTFTEPMNDTRGLCLEPHDLCVHLLATMEPGAVKTVALLVAAGLVSTATLQHRAQLLRVQVPPEKISQVRQNANAYAHELATLVSDRLNLQHVIQRLTSPVSTIA